MSPRLRGFSTTQLLGIADQVAGEFGAQVVDLSALAAAAATTTAEISGARIHQDLSEAGASLRHTLHRLEPLSSHNEELAELAWLILRELNSRD